MMLVAAAAMAFVSCQKEEQNAPQSEQGYITFTSANPDTKTEHNGETIVWSKGDVIRVACQTGVDLWFTSAAGDKAEPKLYASYGLDEGGLTAHFKVRTGGDYFPENLSGALRFYAIYPSTCNGNSASFKNAPNLTYEIKSLQTSTSQSYDKSCDIMYAEAVNEYSSISDIQETGVSLMWTRLVAHAYVTLKGLPVGETINKVTLTAQDGAALVGKYDVDITTGAVSENTPANSVVVNCEGVTVDQNGNATFWACINPCKVKSLNIVVDTDKAVYSIDKTNIDLDFLVNKRNIQPVNMSGAERVEKATGAALPFVETFDVLTKGDHNSTGSQALSQELPNFNIPEGAYLYEASGAIRLAKSGTKGLLETILLDLSSDFYVKVKAKGWDSDEVKLTVKAGSQSQNINLITYNPGGFVEYVVNFEAIDNSESVFFETASGVRVFIDEIEIGKGTSVAAPTIAVQAPDKLASDATSLQIDYTLYNPVDGKNLSASTTADWLTNVQYADGKVTYVVTENTGDERIAEVTLSYEGAEDVTVTVTQDAKPTEGGDDAAKYYVKVTSAPADWSGEYLVVYEYDNAAEILTSELYSGYLKVHNISLGENGILSTDVPENCVVTISSANGGYYIRVASSYITYDSSTKLSLIESVPASNSGIWTIELTSKKNATIANKATNTRFLKYNTATENRFAAYTSSTGKAIQLYKLQTN